MGGESIIIISIGGSLSGDYIVREGEIINAGTVQAAGISLGKNGKFNFTFAPQVYIMRKLAYTDGIFEINSDVSFLLLPLPPWSVLIWFIIFVYFHRSTF